MSSRRKGWRNHFGIQSATKNNTRRAGRSPREKKSAVRLQRQAVTLAKKKKKQARSYHDQIWKELRITLEPQTAERQATARRATGKNKRRDCKTRPCVRRSMGLEIEQTEGPRNKKRQSRDRSCPVENWGRAFSPFVSLKFAHFRTVLLFLPLALRLLASQQPPRKEKLFPSLAGIVGLVLTRVCLRKAREGGAWLARITCRSF